MHLTGHTTFNITSSYRHLNVIHPPTGDLSVTELVSNARPAHILKDNVEAGAWPLRTFGQDWTKFY